MALSRSISVLACTCIYLSVNARGVSSRAILSSWHQYFIGKLFESQLRSIMIIGTIIGQIGSDGIKYNLIIALRLIRRIIVRPSQLIYIARLERIKVTGYGQRAKRISATNVHREKCNRYTTRRFRFERKTEKNRQNIRCYIVQSAW